MLTGEKPFVGDDAMSIIVKHTKSPVPVLPHRLSSHQALINMLLAKRPEHRLQSANEVLEWL
jgi:serine/threonine protein kinase